MARTRTPISTAVFMTTFSGMVPLIGVASLESFLLTKPVRLIRTQRPRRHHPRHGGRARTDTEAPRR